VLPWVAGASAAAALVAALLGYQIGTRQAVQRVGIAQAPVTQTESTFLLLLHVDSNFRRGEPPAPRQALNAEYARWADGTGSVLTGKSLEPVVVWLGRPHPRSTAEDQVDGFFLVRAKNMAAAQQIAATCPHLKHGGWIEVREIGTT